MNAPNHGAHQRKLEKQSVFSAYFRYKTTAYYDRVFPKRPRIKGNRGRPSAGGFKDDGTPPAWPSSSDRLSFYKIYQYIIG